VARTRGSEFENGAVANASAAYSSVIRLLRSAGVCAVPRVVDVVGDVLQDIPPTGPTDYRRYSACCPVPYDVPSQQTLRPSAWTSRDRGHPPTVGTTASRASFVRLISVASLVVTAARWSASNDQAWVSIRKAVDGLIISDKTRSRLAPAKHYVHVGDVGASLGSGAIAAGDDSPPETPAGGC